jgi:dienelactone hydrolase
MDGSLWTGGVTAPPPPRRVYATGESNGGLMAWDMAARLDQPWAMGGAVIFNIFYDALLVLH